ncbi:hypothetical protein D7V64_03010 [Acinetobacter cumulans]|uniref:Uncharacterized protein n=1 Tax=Acinetobacter cumulans TaxID=2136182 RepID=A0A3A8G8U0_9GAMM|nr:hypothetical protein [Acinetobacter cumulans]RKG55295.1 hypothetical protein D7V64_03010 [Acinetobacter cumulans]
MNECNTQEIQEFFQLFQNTLNDIQIHHNETIASLHFGPIFALQPQCNEQHSWQIFAFYQSISVTNPLTEIEYFLNRLLSARHIMQQNIHDLFALIAHYCQAQYKDQPQKKLFALYRQVFSYFFDATALSPSPKQPVVAIEQTQIERCKQQLQTLAAQLKVMILDKLLDPTTATWFQHVESHFNLQAYGHFNHKLSPHLDHLKRWEQENPNRLYWFLLRQDFNHVDDPSYFSYAHLIQLCYLNAPLFRHKGQIKQLFAQPSEQFIAILKLVFSPHTKKAYASQIIFNLIPHLDTPEQLLNLSVILLNSDEPLYEQYVAQYSHALALNLYILNNSHLFFHDIDLSLNDFIYGKQIQGTEYTQLPNIALIHPATTAQSLIRHSAIWHKKSQHIHVSNTPFDFKTSTFVLHECTFELICNSKELMAEAAEMEHCILSFVQAIHDEKYYCFRVRWHDFRGTLGLRYNKEYFKYEFHQLTGKSNALAPEYVIRVAQAFSQYLTVEDIYFDNSMIAA